MLQLNVEFYKEQKYHILLLLIKYSMITSVLVNNYVICGQRGHTWKNMLRGLV